MRLLLLGQSADGTAHDLGKLRDEAAPRNVGKPPGAPGLDLRHVGRHGWPRMTHSPRIAALLVAGGSGSRFGAELPKQYLSLVGRPVIAHAAAALAAEIGLIQPVGDAAAITAALGDIPHLPPVAGGATRQQSVRNGLEALAAHSPDIVLVHDAARPFLPPGTIAALVAALEHHPGAIPAVPVADTLKRGADGLISGTVSRDGLYRAQTPQAFRFPLLTIALPP